MANNPQLAELVSTLEELAKRKKFKRADFFEPYPKQKQFFDLGATKRERMLFGGNQTGKSETGAYETACHLTGDYPSWWKGKRYKRPTKCWMAGETSLVVRDVQQKKLCGEPGVTDAFGTGMIPKSRFVDKPSLARGVTDAYDTIQIEHRTNGKVDGTSIGRFKSYEQGRAKFQGETIDFGWEDEEPDMDVHEEFLARLTGDGAFITTFTPLKGKTELVQRYMGEVHQDRAFVVITLDEAQHFTEIEKKQRLDGYRKYQRDARAKGIPLLGSGRVFDFDEELLKETRMPEVPGEWRKLWGIDFGINHPFAAVLLLWDTEADVMHVHHAIRIESTDERLSLPIYHAAAMKPIGSAVPVAWPQDGHQKDKGSGEALSKIYKAQGLQTLPHHACFADGSNSTEAGILEMETYMTTGRFKVAKHLEDWFEEYRYYHREDGQIVKIRDDLMSATRVAIMAKRFAKPVALGPNALKRRHTEDRARGVDFDPFTGV